MPHFRPFAGLRYKPDIPLGKVIAPPYDVVGPDERAKLAARHPANAIHVELPVDDVRAGLDRYQSAAAMFEEWRRDGVLLPDHSAAFYAYRMTSPNGRSTTGVIGALVCEDAGGDILPHEQTIPKDMSDRLNLLRACRANLSPIWGLSLTRGLGAAYEPHGKPHAEATDDDDVHHALWVVDSPSALDTIATAVDSSPVVLADGHHRYETALTYRTERRAASNGAPGDFDMVMAFVVELSEDHLSVGPIHRTLSGIPVECDLPALFGRWFDTVHAGPSDEHMLDAVGESGALALVTRDDIWLLTPQEQAYVESGSDLDSSLVAPAIASLPEVTTTYVHDWRTAVGTVADGRAQAALLLRPVTVEQIADWAHARPRMPPKSTYFHPKPRTGMVFRVLDN